MLLVSHDARLQSVENNIMLVETLQGGCTVRRLWGLQDGSIQYEVKLTGCLSTSVLSEGEGMDPTHGTLIGPHLNAQLHQHYFCVRLDMAVDDPDGGAALTVSEVSHPFCT